MRKANGFTIVEILIVVGIIGILSTIGFIGFGKYQADTRDSEREAKASIIIEALEKYYDKNGEYPSCTSITDVNTTTVTTSVLPGLDSKTLIAPQAAPGITNSLACTDLTSTSQSDFFAYVGDSSSTCLMGNACLIYQLKYKSESTGRIVTIDSRRSTEVASNETPSLVVLATGFNQIDATWTGVASATSYTLEIATNSTFTLNDTTLPYTSSGTHTVKSLAYGTLYYLRLRAEFAVGSGLWSTTKSVTTWTLGTPVVTRGTETTTSVAFSWTSQQYATSYNYQYRINGGAWSSLQTTTGTSATVTSSNGAKIELQARSVAAGGTSAWSSISTGYLVPGTPTATYGSVTTTTMAFSWSAVTNAARYESVYRLDSGGWSGVINEGANTSRTHGPTTQGTRIEIMVRSVNVDGNASSWSSVVGTTLSVSIPSWNAWGRTESYPYWQTWVYNSTGASICPSGTSIYTQFRDGIYGSYWNGWGGWGSNGASSSTLQYTSGIANYSSTLQTEIQGYCRNESSGAVSSTISTGVSTTSHTPPNVVLSGPVECAGAYSGRPTYHLRLWLQEVSYNLDANQSNINWQLYRYSTSSTYHSYDQTKTWPWSVSINGSGWGGVSNSIAFKVGGAGATETIATGSLTVQHDGNGNATIGYSGSDGPGSSIFGSASCSGSYGLSDLR